MEIWKDVVGYEGIYQVSSYGRVKSLKRIDSNNRTHQERILSLKETPTGYYHVHLSRENKAKWLLVHRLVAEVFCELKDGCDIVNHLDNDPHNNHFENLEWTTYKGNMQHATKQGRMHYQPLNLKKAQISRQKAVIATDKCGNDYYFESQVIAMKELGLTKSARGHIASACKKERGYKTVGGYSWRYA